MAMTSLIFPAEIDQAAPCDACRQHEREIADLRAELTRHRASTRVLRWGWLSLGLLILVAGPATAYSAAAAHDIGFQSPLEIAICECLFTGLYLPGAILAILATLSWRPLIHRCVLFSGAFAMLGAAYLVLHFLEELDSIPWGFYPLMLLASAMPAFLLRLTRRWVVAPPGVDVQPRPASIQTLFVATFLCAAAATAVRWVKLDEELNGNLPPTVLAIILALCALVPAALLGLVIVLAARISLIENWRRALLGAAALGALTLLILTGIVLGVACFVEVNGKSLDQDGMLAALTLALTVGGTTLALSFACFLFLRLLGYRVVRPPGRVLTS